MIGQTVSHYRIETKLGEGGMGVVYQAQDLRLERRVALKFLPSHLVGDSNAKGRFLHEARAASALDHPNICVIYEIDEREDGELFIAMAHYKGETLAQKLDRGPLPIPEALAITHQIAQGLAKAHEIGIIHRDIKPANLMVTDGGLVKILDFGIAKLPGAARLTRSGGMVGTVTYMAPEQAERDMASPQSDLWSVGVVLYEMLSGQLPFQGATPVAVLYRILHEEPDPIREIRREVPAGLERILGRALAKEPEARYGSMGELLGALTSLGGWAEASSFPGPIVVEAESGTDELAATVPPFLTPHRESSEETFLPPFVGRKGEMGVLGGWLGEALAGEGRVGFITGEAGTGKTALVREFSQTAAREDASLIVATGECNAHTGTGDPLHPFREILALLTGDVEGQWTAGSLTADHATRLWGFLPSAARALAEHGPDLLGVLLPGTALLHRAEAHPSLDNAGFEALRGLVERRGAGIQQTDLMDQLIRVFRAMAREKPLILVLDDLQWADAGTVSLLFHLGRRLAGSRILLLGLYRPSEIALGRGGQQHPLEPAIQDLAVRFGKVVIEVGATEDRDFVDAVLDVQPNRLGSEFRNSLFRRTQGHALFTVELLRSMKEQGVLVRCETGEWTAAKGLSWDELPARVDALIEQRMNRLPADLRRFLAIAAVEGTEFTLEAAAQVMGVEVQGLIAQVSLELEKRHRLLNALGIRRMNGQRFSAFGFRHVLFQRFLYDELSEVERVHLHEQVGKALEQLYGERKAEVAVQLAHHFREAGLTEKAVGFASMAGIRARNMSAFAEANGYFEEALRALLTLPAERERDRQELQLQLDLASGRVLVGHPGQAEAVSRAHELALELGLKEELFWVQVWRYWIFAHYPGENRLGKKLAEEVLSLARELGEKKYLIWGVETVGRNAMLRGDFPTALARCREVDALYTPLMHHDDRALAFMDLGPVSAGMIGLTYWFLGFPDQALSWSQEGVRRALQQKSPVSTLLLMQTYLAWTYTWRREHREALQEIRALRARAEEVGMGGMYALFTGVFEGWCILQAGDVPGGIETMQRGLEEWVAVGWKTQIPYFTALLAQGLLLDGRAEQALDAVKKAHAASEGMDDLWHEVEVHRTLGDLYLGLQNPSPAEAEAAYRHAIVVARGQEARLPELRATTSLARTLQTQGRTSEAHAMLTEIYDWFTEGFDTEDLKEAKALLQNLGSG